MEGRLFKRSGVRTMRKYLCGCGEIHEDNDFDPTVDKELNDWNWALSLIKEGKNVRRATWKDKNAYIHKGGLFSGQIVNNKNQDFKPALSTFDAMDWEEYNPQIIETIQEGMKVYEKNLLKRPNTIRLNSRMVAKLRKECDFFCPPPVFSPPSTPSTIFGMDIEVDERIDDGHCFVFSKEKSKITKDKLITEIKNGITLSDDCYDFIKDKFEPFWKQEWNKLEGEINQFAFKFYKEGFKQGVKTK